MCSAGATRVGTTGGCTIGCGVGTTGGGARFGCDWGADGASNCGITDGNVGGESLSKEIEEMSSHEYLHGFQGEGRQD